MNIVLLPEQETHSGPSKYELMTSLFSRVPVEFSDLGAEGEDKYSFVVRSIEAKDDTGENWFIWGDIVGEERKLYACWNTLRQEGTVRVER